MKSVMKHDYSKIPAPRVPRSIFNLSFGHKTTFNAGLLIPVMCIEVLPGDVFSVKANLFARMSTLISPIMDNLYLDTQYFFCPNRILWENWESFMTGGSHTVPIITTNDEAIGSIYDYFGCPTEIANNIPVNALPFRAYQKIYNEWYRPQDIITPLTEDNGDGPDITSYSIQRRAKRHDYFTSCLSSPQSGDAVELPLGTSAPVIGDGTMLGFDDGNQIAAINNATYGTFTVETTQKAVGANWSGTPMTFSQKVLGVSTDSTRSGLIADLSSATAATINSLRQAFQLQKILERDIRGGTRYSEMLRAHFDVISPDQRLQRPEYLGGSSQRIQINSVPQTSESGTTEQGNLAAYGLVSDSKGRWNRSFTEHGFIIGIASVRADLTYQQGLDRFWSRQTRYDYYLPAMAHLGEQAVLTKELYAKGVATDEDVFGYQERWAEYRQQKSIVSGELRSEFATTLDNWHLSQEFGTVPTLNATFIIENPPIARVSAYSEGSAQFIFDSYFEIKAARLMPTYGIPGLIDHF